MFSSICKQHLFKNVIKTVNANNNIGLLNGGFLPIYINEKHNSTYIPNILKKNNDGTNENGIENTTNTFGTSLFKQTGFEQGKIPLKKSVRTLSTVNHSHHHPVPVAINKTAVSKDESREFMSVFPDLVRDLSEMTKKYDHPQASNWLIKALQYNVPRGKKNRGLATVTAFKILAPKENHTDENLKLAHYLGWCVEMVQSVFLILDDIMDASETRRGQPCWYKLNDVGLMAINDGLMIENCIYHILKKHFSNEDYYVKLIELFHEVTFITTVGQLLDLQTANNDVSTFTMEKYKKIVSNKTSYYTFYLPVALAMHMTGYTDLEIYRQTKTILLEMGYFFQVQDDFLDCFGDPNVTGKIGTDIQDGKCTWLSVVFMQRATPEQKLIMKECYGQKDPEKVAKIKHMYEEIGLPNTYSIYEEDSYKMIKTHIQQTSRGMPHDVFFKIMEKIYRRDS